jgi:hypothetical protein
MADVVRNEVVSYSVELSEEEMNLLFNLLDAECTRRDEDEGVSRGPVDHLLDELVEVFGDMMN